MLPALLDRVYREDSGRVRAALVARLGDLDLAEECVQEAFAAALEQWPRTGAPENPRAWLITIARNKAIDRLRRRTHFEAIVARLEEPVDPVEDDRLRLVFTCCHPALALDAQVALTLSVVAGLATDEIARAFLTPLATLAQRLVRAKKKIREARIPYRVPAPEELPARVEAVCAVVYLVFTEGYAATAGDNLIRRELSGEAIRLGRLLHGLLPASREVAALLALMLLHDARREARVDRDGEVVLLEEQDRSLWDSAQMAEGITLVRRALGPEPGPYALQAAIGALHAEAAVARETDWPQIVALYRLLDARQPSPVTALNLAVAIAMAEGPARGLAEMDGLAGPLDGYHLFHAARADLLRRLGDPRAGDAYRAALARVGNAPERRFLERRLAAVSADNDVN